MSGHFVTLRLATLADAAAMAGIYRPYVEGTAITFELAAPSAEEFARRIAHTLEKYPWLVAERDGEVVGYAYAGPLKTRATWSSSTGAGEATGAPTFAWTG